jgi:hypothetical protein
VPLPWGAPHPAVVIIDHAPPGDQVAVNSIVLGTVESQRSSNPRGYALNGVSEDVTIHVGKRSFPYKLFAGPQKIDLYKIPGGAP